MTPQEAIVPLCAYCKDGCLFGYGLCHCGCGRTTHISPRNYWDRNLFKDKPAQFFRGHGSRMVPKKVDEEVFYVDGDPCRHIPLSRGMFAIVDADNYEWLMQWKWTAVRGAKKRDDSFYAKRTSRKIDGERVSIWMHKEILGENPYENGKGDHKDPERSLDNRRHNLRFATFAENNRNCRKHYNSASGYKGVHFYKPSKTKPWRATICAAGVKHYLGAFATKEEAYAVYCAAAVKYHGEFARFS